MDWHQQMPPKQYLHDHPEFKELIQIVSNELSIDPVLSKRNGFIGALTSKIKRSSSSVK